MTARDFPPAYAKRQPSLDVLRGLSVALMIMANTATTASWAIFRHSAWNGLTLADLVFPAFLFLAGASIVYSFETRLVRGASRARLAKHAVSRAGALFLLGLILNAFPFANLAHLRIYGVLQRIALCYLAAALLYLWNRRAWTKLALCAVLLLGYWVMLRWIPVPGAGLPGRDTPFLDQRNNIVSWLDRTLLSGHLYLPANPPTYDLRDPEGLLSTLPAIATTLLGMFSALLLRSRRAEAPAKSLALAAFSVFCLALGYLWSIWFPLNKNLWTSSYVLVSAGWTLAALALVYWAIEVKGWRDGWTWPWAVLGANSIAAYLVSEMLAGVLLNLSFRSAGGPTNGFQWLFYRTANLIPNPGMAAFCFSLAFLALSFLAVWLLWRRRLFVKI